METPVWPHLARHTRSARHNTWFGIMRLLCRYRHKTHWTGHPSRLNRDLTGPFGSKAYANEELAAEITAAFVCAALSIKPTVRHADYLGSWLNILREDNRAIFRAASKASKAADFLLAFRKAEPALLPDGEAAR